MTDNPLETGAGRQRLDRRRLEHGLRVATRLSSTVITVITVIIVSLVALVVLGWQLVAGDLPLAVRLLGVPLGTALGCGLIRLTQVVDDWMARRAS